MRRVLLLALALALATDARAEAPGYAQPAHALVLPFDATDGRVSFLYVSRIDEGSEPIAVHWVYWSDAGMLLAEEVRCMRPGRTVVVDPGAARFGDDFPLRHARGLATATAYTDAVECGGIDGSPLSETLAGGFTIADLESGSAFGHDALGFARSADGSHIDLPVERALDDPGEIVLQAFAPDSLDFSLLILLGLREGAGTSRFPGELGPLIDVRGKSTAVLAFGRTARLPDVGFDAAFFTTLDRNGLVGAEGVIPSSALLSFTDLAEGGRRIDGDDGNANTRVFGLLGQSIGPFGTSTRARTRAAPPTDGILPATPPPGTPTPRPTQTPRESAQPQPTASPSAPPDPRPSPTPGGPARPTPTATAGPTPTGAPVRTPAPTASALPAPTLRPTPTAGPATPTPLVVPLACPSGRRLVRVVLAAPEPLAGTEIVLTYTSELSLPGAGASSTVAERVHWSSGSDQALREINDQEGTLRLAWVDPTAQAASELRVEVDFDCPGGMLPTHRVPVCVERTLSRDGRLLDADCIVSAE